MAMTATAPTKPASSGKVDPASVATKKEAIGLVIAGKWGEKEYLAWEALQKAASEQGVSVRVSRPDPDKKRVGGRLVLTGDGIGGGSQYGVMTLTVEQAVLLCRDSTRRAILTTMLEEVQGKNPEIKVKTYSSGPKQGQTHEVWTLGDLETESPETLQATVEQAIKRLAPVGANGNGNGRK